MAVLLRHELRRVWRRRFSWQAGLLVLLLLSIGVYSVAHGGGAIVLCALAVWVGLTPVLNACGGAIRALRSEWAQGTASLWLSLDCSAERRVGAKLIAALSRFCAMALGTFAIASFAAVGFMLELGGVPAAVIRRTWAAVPAIRFLGDPAKVLSFIAHFGLADLCQLLLWGPPLAVLGLAIGVGLLSVGRVRRRTGIWVFWPVLVVWVLLSEALRYAPPIIARASLGGGEVGWHFLPAGRLDVYAHFAPGLAVSLWPLFLSWLIAALLFPLVAWWVRHRAYAW